jgi:aldose 1-epimerase
MFSTSSSTEDGFDKVFLKDEATGTIATVVPSCGAILQSFTIVKDGKEFNVIESYESADDFRKNVTSKGFLGAKLSPFVCRLNKGKYSFEGREYTIEKYFNGNHALHGILYDQPFRIIEQGADQKKTSVSMMHEYRGIDGGYPFFYDCLVKYELEKENRLNVITEVTNKDEIKIPVQDGWHPYFTLGAKLDELELQFHSKERVEFNEELIPTGKLSPYIEFNAGKKLGDTFLDNCFMLDSRQRQPMCILKNPGKNIQVEIHPGGSYPYLQIYTPPHRNSIAIENISGTPDGFNNGSTKILSPGETAIFKTSYKITLLT